MYSLDYYKYLKKIRNKRIFIITMQVIILVLFLLGWELLSRFNIINSFIYSSPSNIVKTIYKLIIDNNIFNHIFITIYETFISFILATFIGIIIAIIFWYSRTLYKIFEPYLTVINSLPKVALGPIIIIIFGANINSIIIMALLISLIITISNVYNGFINTDNGRTKLLYSFGANKWQVLKYLVIPYNCHVIINVLKINVSMSLIGVIMGEFLVSKEGIGYLINYGSQVFNLNLVFSGIIILLIVSYLMYLLIIFIERILVRNN